MNVVEFGKDLLSWFDKTGDFGTIPFISIKDCSLSVEKDPERQNIAFQRWATTKSSLSFIEDLEVFCGNNISLKHFIGDRVESISVKKLQKAGCKLFTVKRGRAGDTFAHYLIACEFLRSGGSKHAIASFILAKNFTDYVSSKQNDSLIYRQYTESLVEFAEARVAEKPDRKAINYITNEQRMLSRLVFGRLPWAEDEPEKLSYEKANPNHYNMPQACTWDERGLLEKLRLCDSQLISHEPQYRSREEALTEKAKKYIEQKYNKKNKPFFVSPFNVLLIKGEDGKEEPNPINVCNFCKNIKQIKAIGAASINLLPIG